LAALAHQCGDRVPVDFWASQSLIARIRDELGLGPEAFLDRYDVDLRYIAGPRYVGPPLRDGEDIWGVPRTTVRVATREGVETYEELATAPLAGASTVADVEVYPRWPSPDWYDYTGIEAQCDALRAQGRVVVFMGDRLNRVAQLKPAMYLRGIEAILIDVATNEAMAVAVFRQIREFYTEYLRRILAAARGKIDIVLTGDDFGAQHGLLVAPDTWRRLLRPGFAEYLALIRGAGCKSMHHTCGSVVELIPDLIGCGLDVLQALQPEAANMSFPALRIKFGRDLCFQGGISIQQTMPFGTPDQIRREVRQIADAVGRDGGYIFCTSHNIQADTPMRNVVALMEAYAEFGRR